MKIGDIVYLKQYKSIVGEVKAIDDKDLITLALCDTDMELVVADYEIGGVTEATQPHRDSGKTVNILGTPYKILLCGEEDYRYDREADGWCDTSVKEILLFNYKQSADSVRDLVAYQKKVLRHEIVHAFLYESGLWQNADGSKCWAKNEEMIDWIAIQEPKLHKAFIEAGCEEG